MVNNISLVSGYNSEQTFACIVPSEKLEIVFSPRSWRACEQIVTSVSFVATSNPQKKERRAALTAAPRFPGSSRSLFLLRRVRQTHQQHRKHSRER